MSKIAKNPEEDALSVKAPANMKMKRNAITAA
jgi:hypothetical protein